MTDAAIAQLENRLKTVTARIEQVEKQLASGGGSSGSSGASSGGASASSGGGAAFVSAYDNLVSQYIDDYVKLSAQLGDADVQKQATSVKQAITAQRNFLEVASQSKKPSDSDLPKLLEPTSKAMNDVATIRNQKGKQHAKFNYLSTLSEGINALGWVAITPAPAPFVDESRASSEFYSNKILMEYKNKEGGEVHKAWVHAVNEFLKELKNYVKQYHTTGVAWNPKGGDASSASSSSSSGGGAAPPPVPSGGGPPAPPPGGGPPSGPPSGDDSSSAGGGGRAALLAEIDAVRERQKGGRTEGLKKVTADQKAKNRDPNDVVHVEFKERGTAAKAGAKPAVTKPPRIELEGNKWVIEWQQGNKNIVISETETRHTVYIYKCENSVIQIKGKVNSIAVDGCKKTGIVFESAIATAELVNCQSVQLQVLGRVPNIAVDKTDGCQLHLSKDCLDVEILTAKVSEMNINIPNPKDPNGDPIERPVPEQFKTVLKGATLETVAVQHLA